MFTTIFMILENLFFVSFIKNQEFKKKLSHKEELYHINEYIINNNKDSRNILIEHNLRLVAHICKKYENNKDLNEDLISIGTIGLIKAIDSYHPDKCAKLSTYASRCIENELLMHLRTHKKTSLDVSLNEILGYDKEGNEMTLIDIIPDVQENITDTLYTQFKIDRLKTYFPILTQREQEILILRYGLNNNKEYTQKEIAKKLHISRSYVSRIEKKALIRLYKCFLEDKEKRI